MELLHASPEPRFKRSVCAIARAAVEIALERRDTMTIAQSLQTLDVATEADQDADPTYLYHTL